MEITNHAVRRWRHRMLSPESDGALRVRIMALYFGTRLAECPEWRARAKAKRWGREATFRVNQGIVLVIVDGKIVTVQRQGQSDFKPVRSGK